MIQISIFNSVLEKCVYRFIWDVWTVGFEDRYSIILYKSYRYEAFFVGNVIIVAISEYGLSFVALVGSGAPDVTLIIPVSRTSSS